MIRQNTIHASLGELIAALYEQYLAYYDDTLLASLAVTTTINELIEDDAAAARQILGDLLD
jgi:hypothetical protein